MNITEKVKNVVEDTFIKKGTDVAKTKITEIWEEVKPIAIEVGIGILLFRFGYSALSIPKRNDSNLHIYFHIQ